MKRSKMKLLLDSTTEKDLLPIFIPSYNRPHFKLGERILPMLTPKALSKVHLVVRAEQYNQYRKSNAALLEKGLTIISIPKGCVTGLGTTRQYIIDYAISNRIPYIMDMDDDIKYLQYLYNGISKSGQKCSKHTGVRDWDVDPTIPQKVLQLAGRISRDCFREHPEVLLGNIRRQRFSQHADNAQIKYMINKGPTPRQTKLLNIKGIKKYGVKMPKAFDIHGEDMGFAAEVLQRGGSCFNIPCLCYDYVDEKVDSVVRDPHNPEKNRPLHRAEYKGLMKMEIKDYLKTSFTYPDGEYMFGDVDWRRYHKLHGTEPIIKGWDFTDV